jgi:hypothetical protein
MQKTILLDFDGTVTADVNEPSNETERERLRPYPVEFADVSIVMWIDPTVLMRLAVIAELPGVSVFWLSANGAIVPAVIAPQLGLPDWRISPRAPAAPAVGVPASGRAGTYWWKFQAVLETVEAGDSVRVLWVDDRISGDMGFHFDRTEQSGRISWIVPDGRCGLSAHEIDLIQAFAEDGKQVRWDAARGRG